MSAHRPKHARAIGAVFVDDSGRRARWAHLALRAVAALCVAGFALFLVSLFGGVPLPGLSDPVQLPSNEAAHPRGQQPSPNTAAATRTRSTSPAARVSVVVARPSSSAIIRSATVTTSTTARRTTPAPTSSAPRSSSSPAPSAHASNGRTHANTNHPTPTKTR